MCTCICLDILSIAAAVAVVDPAAAVVVVVVGVYVPHTLLKGLHQNFILLSLMSQSILVHQRNKYYLNLHAATHIRHNIYYRGILLH